MGNAKEQITNAAGPAGSFHPRGALVLAIGLVACVALWAGWKWWPRDVGTIQSGRRPVPEDPRLTYDTPFRNVRPEVKYVGDEICAGCHRELAQSYHHHPMGRSLDLVQKASPIERFDTVSKNPFTGLGFTYEIKRQGEKVVHRETAADSSGRLISEAETDVQFAIGSGVRGRSYLINRNGYLFESPITWYTQKAVWDLSPGYERMPHHFGRPVVTDCLFCHANRVREVPDTENHYYPPVFEGYAIGCERCHGPGELHVRRQETREAYEGVDFTIVNPVHLEPAIREAVCQQCHLEGLARVLRRGRQAFDFRPGLPLHLFLSVYVNKSAGEGPEKFVGQVEQMYASRCFRESQKHLGGQQGDPLGCVSCHDPHFYPSAGERVKFYRERCLNCHKDQGCSLPLEVRKETSKEDSCVQCHMPVTGSDIQHHSITNHRIPRHANEAEERPAPAEDDLLPIQLFHRNLVDASDPEVERDLGVALMERVERYPPPLRRALGALALSRLDSAVRADPTDVFALEARAHALWAIGDFAGAATAFDLALEQSPHRELLLQWAAVLAIEQKRPRDAIPYLQKAIEVNPWRHEFHHFLAEANAQLGGWPIALKECQEALRLNPADIQSRRLLVEAHLALVQPEQAKTEFERLLGLHPPNEKALREWFARRTGAGLR